MTAGEQVYELVVGFVHQEVEYPVIESVGLGSALSGLSRHRAAEPVADHWLTLVVFPRWLEDHRLPGVLNGRWPDLVPGLCPRSDAKRNIHGLPVLFALAATRRYMQVAGIAGVGPTVSVRGKPAEKFVVSVRRVPALPIPRHFSAIIVKVLVAGALPEVRRVSVNEFHGSVPTGGDRTAYVLSQPGHEQVWYPAWPSSCRQSP